MSLSTLWQSTKQYLLTPRQLMIMDAHGHRQTRRLLLRPITLLVLLIAIPLVSFLAGMYSSYGKGMGTVVPQYIQLQRDYEKASDKLAATEAELAVLEQERDILRSDILTMQEQQEEFQQRINGYESILEARKAEGVQIISSHMRWEDDDTIAFRITLVKGGNFPRQVSGSIQIMATSPEGEQVFLSVAEAGAAGAADSLPYRMETHTFLYGKAKWTHDWRPQQFTVICTNNRGKEVARQEQNI